MSYAARKWADTVPVVRSWEVREAAVSTVNAVAATSMPASRATVRTAPNRSCDQASLRMVDGPPRVPWCGRIERRRC